MDISSLIPVLLFSVCIITMSMGIIVIQNNRKLAINWYFFALMIAVSLWSIGLALSNVASDIATSEIWRRLL